MTATTEATEINLGAPGLDSETRDTTDPKVNFSIPNNR